MSDYRYGSDSGYDRGLLAAGRQSGRRYLGVVSASTFEGKEVLAREWFAPNLIPARNVTIVNGDGGTGKSLLLTQLAVAATSGTPWIGLQVAQGGCLYLSAEDDLDELHRRLANVSERAGVRFSDLEQLRIVPLAGEDAVLAAPKPASNMLLTTGLFDAVDEELAKTRPALVVLDTLADLFGGEQNQRAQARQFIGLLRGWAIKHQTTVVLLAHPSQSGMVSGTGSSGNTAWNNSVRSRLYLERVTASEGSKAFEPDPDARVLRTVKANYGRTGGEIPLRWVEGVLEPKAQSFDSSMARMSAEHRADQVFLNLLARFEAEGRQVSPLPNAPTYGPSYFSRHGDAEGITKRGLEAAMNRLFASGRIRVGKSHGSPSKQKDIIVRA
ncbi:ATPase [Arsenicitalea aurantiaca]|uniref:ATPase n=1 Tax=Arsenicitalea aurantiaca TaxID=1783274 RepID=A0A433X360_9HYPH|nr:AAA family ATPase [Arsenicitalea aurantiaca]RUT28498.1 ATPase [Arsenicitalea aurantiaca]